jgi:hypothetical protein
MAAIPAKINGVIIEFDGKAINEVEQRLVDVLAWLVSPGVPYKYLLSKMYVYSVKDRHEWPSRHTQQKAVDISRINGIRIADGYGRDPAVTDIVQRLQEEFEKLPGRRENFGPHLQLKHGKPYPVKGHHDHIHFSVD